MPAEEWIMLLILLAIFWVIFSIARALEDKIVRLCRFLNGKLWDFFVWPLTALYGCTLKKLFTAISNNLKNTGYGRLDDSLSAFGGIKTMLFGLAAVLFVALRLIFVPDDLIELCLTLFYSTAIGSPFPFFIEGMSFSLATLIGAAFTRYLSMEAMRRGESMGLIPKLIYGFIFLCAFGLLGTAMSGIFDSLSAFSVDTFNWIFTTQGYPNAPEFVNWIIVGLLILLLIIIYYLWAVLAIMTLKEYLSNLVFGIVPLTLMVLVLSLLSSLDLIRYNWLSLAVVLGIGIWAEFHRHKLENLTEQQLKTRKEKSGKWNPFIKKKKMPKHNFFGDDE